MTDRGLLEFAAKAAGIELDWDVPPKSPPWRITGSGEGRGPAAQWNPLTDDGDALRLAVKLNIRLEPNFGDGFHFALAGIDNPNYFPELVWESEFEWLAEEVSQEDPMGATRRAIVRAAVEIGKRRA